MNRLLCKELSSNEISSGVIKSSWENNRSSIFYNEMPPQVKGDLVAARGAGAVDKLQALVLTHGGPKEVTLTFECVQDFDPEMSTIQIEWREVKLTGGFIRGLDIYVCYQWYGNQLVLAMRQLEVPGGLVPGEDPIWRVLGEKKLTKSELSRSRIILTQNDLSTFIGSSILNRQLLEKNDGIPASLNSIKGATYGQLKTRPSQNSNPSIMGIEVTIYDHKVLHPDLFVVGKMIRVEYYWAFNGGLYLNFTIAG